MGFYGLRNLIGQPDAPIGLKEVGQLFGKHIAAVVEDGVPVHVRMRVKPSLYLLAAYPAL